MAGNSGVINSVVIASAQLKTSEKPLSLVQAMEGCCVRRSGRTKRLVSHLCVGSEQTQVVGCKRRFAPTFSETKLEKNARSTV